MSERRLDTLSDARSLSATVRQDDLALMSEIAETALCMAEESGARGDEVARLRAIKNRLQEGSQ